MTAHKGGLGNAPIQPEYLQQMNDLAHSLDRLFNHGKLPLRETGFVLLVFPFGQGEGHRCNYISNANREDVITMLREQLAYFAGMPDDTRGKA